MYDGLKITGMNAYEVKIQASSALYQVFLEGEYLEYILYGEFITDKSITKSVKKLHSAALCDLFATDDSLLNFIEEWSFCG